MNRQADWIGLPEALRIILDTVGPTTAERIPLAQALARTLAQDVRAPLDLPPWDNSAMDGFAVRAQDVRAATRDRPVALELVESVPAGAFASRSVGEQQAIKIMTGAPIPAGADSVVRVEHTAEQDGRVLVFSDADAGRNIRPRGEDVCKDSVAFEAGRVLRPGEIGLLAAFGQATVRVHRKPRVAILSTGDELVDLADSAEAIAGRKIVNSNSYALAAAVQTVGADPVLLGIARDTHASLRKHLRRGLKYDALITSAGASVGEHDLVKVVLEELGVRTHFWRVRMRPGSPFSFGTLGAVPVFGLPGNPVSALVTCELFVKPALRRMLGRKTVHTRTMRARMTERVESKPGLTHFLRAQLTRDSAGTWLARLTGAQGSGMISSVANADGLLIVPERTSELPAGAEVRVIVLAPTDESQMEPEFE